MTDNEFIQALRAVAKKYEGKPVATFETNISNMATDAADHIERLCDEINRQNAEIERLENSGIHASSVEDWLSHCRKLRSEAIKEFAERLKKKYENYIICTWKVLNEEIDSLVKEMTEGQL